MDFTAGVNFVNILSSALSCFRVIEAMTRDQKWRELRDMAACCCLTFSIVNSCQREENNVGFQVSYSQVFPTDPIHMRSQKFVGQSTIFSIDGIMRSSNDDLIKYGLLRIW